MPDPGLSAVPVVPSESSDREKAPRPGGWLSRDRFIVGILAVLMLGSAAIFAVALLISQMQGYGPELAAIRDVVPLVQEFRDLRARGADDAAWTAFEARVAARLSPHTKRLEQRASISRPASQKLFWVMKYRMGEMIQACRTTPGPQEQETVQMLRESAAILSYELPADL